MTGSNGRSLLDTIHAKHVSSNDRPSAPVLCAILPAEDSLLL